MNTEQNQSHSFRKLRDGLRQLVSDSFASTLSSGGFDGRS